MIGKLCMTLALLAPGAVLAAAQSVTETAHYTLADSDSRNDARQICAANAKRTALDRAGSLFESDLTTRKTEANGKLVDDTRLQMRSSVAAVVGAEVVAETFIVSNDRLAITCMIKLTFDPAEVKTKLQDLAGHAELRQKLAAQQAQMDALASQVRSLSAGARAPLADSAAAPQPRLSLAPPDAPVPAPQVDQAQEEALPTLPLPRTVPPWPVAPRAQAQVVYPPVTVYPPPATSYYYYPPARYAYEPQAYPRWYYAPRRGW